MTAITTPLLDGPSDAPASEPSRSAWNAAFTVACIIMRWVPILLCIKCFSFGIYSVQQTSHSTPGIVASGLLLMVLCGFVACCCVSKKAPYLKKYDDFTDVAFRFLTTLFIPMNKVGKGLIRLYFRVLFLVFILPAAFTTYMGAFCLNVPFFKDKQHEMLIDGKPVTGTELVYVTPWDNTVQRVERDHNVKSMDAVGITKDGARIKGVMSIPFRISEDPNDWAIKEEVTPKLTEAIKGRFAATVAQFNAREINRENLAIAFGLGTADQFPIPKTVRWNGIIEIESVNVFFRDPSAKP